MASDPRLPHIPQSKKVVPSSWSWSQLGDACTGVFDCPHSTPKITDDGPLVVRTQDILSGVFRADQAAHVSHETYLERIGKAEPRCGDLLYSREGTYFGIAAQVPPDRRICLGQRMVLLRSNPKIVNPRFLCYWLNSPTMARHVAGYRDGSVAERLNLPTIRALPVVLPPLTVQDQIAHILGVLDDKIELNRRMNETLEAMARALFKSWFIDFDPVHAKAEGRDPGLPADIAALFPNSFEDSDTGQIPKGWELDTFGALLSLAKGLSYKGEFLSDNGVPMVNLGCFLGQGHFKREAMKSYLGDYQDRHTVKPGDLVLANTDITQRREVIGSPGIVPRVAGDCELIFTHHVYAARFREGMQQWKPFVFFYLLSDRFRHRATGFATGTTVLALPREAVVDCQFSRPPDALIQAFNRLVTPFQGLSWQLEEQSGSLAVLRDALLPKLLSGELRVKDVDQSMEAHA